MQKLKGNLSIEGLEGPDVVHVALFSDTILFYSSEMEASNVVVDTVIASCFFDVCSAVFHIALGSGMPIRMGIAYGDTAISAEDSLFVGLPLVWAHEIEISQNWIGGACHSSCEVAPWFSETSGSWADVLRYDVPVHQGCQSPIWALNWTRGGLAEFTQLLRQLMAQAPPEVRNKYEAAISFGEWAEEATWGQGRQQR